jgi:hypothetical protein
MIQDPAKTLHLDLISHQIINYQNYSNPSFQYHYYLFPYYYYFYSFKNYLTNHHFTYHYH